MQKEHDAETYAIIGAAMEVHRQMGHGFLEAVYQEAAAVEFQLRGIPFEREVSFDLKYKDVLLPTHYRADFVCYGSIIVEFKAQSDLTSADEGQVINYLKATGYHRGVLLNFGAPSLQSRRLVFGFGNK